MGAGRRDTEELTMRYIKTIDDITKDGQVDFGAG